ncbi:MAG: hypothetical protein AAF804_03725 [Bacteroidota bacterium]
MTEYNKDRLKRALESLPRYTPKEELWDQLSQELDKDSSRDATETAGDQALERAIRELPRYQAPQRLWGRIERRMNQTYSPVRTWLGVAASVLLVMGIAIGSSWQSPKLQVDVELSEKQVTPRPDLSIPQDVSQPLALPPCLEDEDQSREALLARTQLLDILEKIEKAYVQGNVSERDSLQALFEAQRALANQTHCSE